MQKYMNAKMNKDIVLLSRFNISQVMPRLNFSKSIWLTRTIMNLCEVALEIFGLIKSDKKFDKDKYCFK